MRAPIPDVLQHPRPARWRLLQIFNEACSGDEQLRQEVESLITSDQGGLSFIEQPAFEMAASVLASDEPSMALLCCPR